MNCESVKTAMSQSTRVPQLFSMDKEDVIYERKAYDL